MSQSHASILDDECDRGMERVKICCRGENDELLFVVSALKNGELVLGTLVFYMNAKFNVRDQLLVTFNFALYYPWLYESTEEGSNPGEMHIDVSSGVNSGTVTSGLRLH